MKTLKSFVVEIAVNDYANDDMLLNKASNLN